MDSPCIIHGYPCIPWMSMDVMVNPWISMWILIDDPERWDGKGEGRVNGQSVFCIRLTFSKGFRGILGSCWDDHRSFLAGDWNVLLTFVLTFWWSIPKRSGGTLGPCWTTFGQCPCLKRTIDKLSSEPSREYDFLSSC